MKIDAKKLQTFLGKATLNSGISTALLDIHDKSLNIWVRSADNAKAVMASLKNINEPDAKWAIKDTTTFINVLKLFDGIVELKQENNKLSIFDKSKQVDIVLAEESFIENVLPKKMELPYEKKVLINTSIFKNAVKNKSTIKAEEMVIEFDETNLIITVGSKNEDTIKEKIMVPYIKACSKFGAAVDEVIAVIGEKIEVGLKTDFPITLREDTTEYEIIYVVAPRVSKEDGE